MTIVKLNPIRLQKSLDLWRDSLREEHNAEDLARLRASQISQAIIEIKRLAFEEGIELK